MRALPLVVAFLLTAAPVAGAIGATVGAPEHDGAGSPVAPSSTTVSVPTSDPSGPIHVLAVPPDEVSGSSIEGQGSDLGPAMGFASNATEARLETLTMVERITAAKTTEQRQRRILGALNDIEQQVIVLKGRQQQAIAAYAAGDVDHRRLLVRMARVDAEARALEARREQLATLADETSDFGLDAGRLANLERELDTYTGPVRYHAARVLGGGAEPTRFYVETGSNAVVLSAIVGDEYVREAYRGDLRNRNRGGISPETALNATQQGYPTIWRLRQDSTEVVGSGNSYLVRVSHERGLLAAFVDSGSERVFKEFQRRPLTAIDEGEAISDVKDGLRLTVNRTYPGGPLRVQLNESDTGDPVAANITIGSDGQKSDLVGSTGPDGRLWTISPDGTFTVTAIRGNSVVVLTVDPTPPPLVGAPTNETPPTNDSDADPIVTAEPPPSARGSTGMIVG